MTNTWKKADSFDLGIMMCTHGLSDEYANLLLPVLTLIVAELNLSKFDTGILLSSFSIATFFSLYPISLFADYSGRKKLILSIGLLTALLAFLGMTWATAFWMLLALAFLACAGNSTYHPCGTALTATRFAHHRAIAISIHGTGGHLGMSLMPVVQAVLIADGGFCVHSDEIVSTAFQWSSEEFDEYRGRSSVVHDTNPTHFASPAILREMCPNTGPNVGQYSE